MSNKVVALLMLSLALSFKLEAQVNKYAFGDSIFVWASSLNLRESPNPNAKILGRVAYGSTVVIVDDEIGKVAIKHQAITPKTAENGAKYESFYLNGFWVKVNFNGTVGYVFDGYLSKIFPVTNFKPEQNDMESWIRNSFHLQGNEYVEELVRGTEYISDSKNIKGFIGKFDMIKVSSISFNEISFEEGVMIAIQLFGTPETYLPTQHQMDFIRFFEPKRSNCFSIQREKDLVKITQQSICY
jgi:hypothetical protein